MATFYKYKERDIDSQVNWADIGLGMSDMITDQLAVRKEKKEAYDDQVRAFNQYLDEHPTGQDKNLTEWTAAYSSDMQKKILDNQRAFKNGMISERDNVTFMQNVKNGTSTIFNLATEFQGEYKVKMDRISSTDPLTRSQPIEPWLMEQVDGYSNYKTSNPIIDPKTGLVLMSMKRKDGTYETASAANLSNRIKAQYNYFDSDAAATKIEEGFGEDIRSTYVKAKNRLDTGTVLDVQDKRAHDDFLNSLNMSVSAALATPLATSSILTADILFEEVRDKDGNVISYNPVKYTATFSKEEADADPYKILMVTTPGGDGTPMPDFSSENGKKQVEKAKTWLVNKTLSKIDYKEGSEVIAALGAPAPNPAFAQMAGQKAAEEAALKTYAENFSNLVFGQSQQMVDNAGQALGQGFGSTGAISIDKQGTAIAIIDATGTKRWFALDGGPQPIKAALGAAGVPITNQDRVLELIMQNKGGRGNSPFSTKVISPLPATEGNAPTDFSIFNPKK
jgi:hypothetical protein